MSMMYDNCFKKILMWIKEDHVASCLTNVLT